MTIEDVDGFSGDVFEEVIQALYDSMEGRCAKKTLHSHDNGADVVVFDDGKRGLLLQFNNQG